MNTDVIALLGHVSFALSQRRRETIRPHLHKDYAALCSSTMPETNLLFGDELQTQLSHIRASNKIGNTASSSTSHKREFNQGGHAFKSNKPFFRANSSVVQSTEQLCETRAPSVQQSTEASNSTGRTEIDPNVISKLQPLKVSENEQLIPTLVESFRFKTYSFQAGQISNYLSDWRALTSNKEILETVS